MLSRRYSNVAATRRIARDVCISDAHVLSACRSARPCGDSAAKPLLTSPCSWSCADAQSLHVSSARWHARFMSRRTALRRYWRACVEHSQLFHARRVPLSRRAAATARTRLRARAPLPTYMCHMVSDARRPWCCIVNNACCMHASCAERAVTASRHWRIHLHTYRVKSWRWT